MHNRVKVQISNKVPNGIIRVITTSVPIEKRSICGFLCNENDSEEDIDGYACILTKDKELYETNLHPAILLDESIHIQSGDVLQVNKTNQFINFLFRANGNSNCLFVTDCCNSHCLMCPQPPKEENSVRFSDLQQLINCLPEDLQEICITGGEPTLLGRELVDLLKQLAGHCPECHVHILTNGRNFKNLNYAYQCLSTGLKGISFGIPLYSSVEETHDYIVQAHDSFKETIEGIYNLAKLDASIEIRVVLTKINSLDLKELVDFIYHNLPFVDHIALMGMEHMGYVKKNWDAVYIDPLDYQESLVSAVRFLRLRGMNVSIYNLPLCILDNRLWKFSRKSISDFKQGYDETCKQCELQSQCGGVFVRQKNSMSLRPLSRSG